jgi:hypothetical protein
MADQPFSQVASTPGYENIHALIVSGEPKSEAMVTDRLYCNHLQQKED